MYTLTDTVTMAETETMMQMLAMMFTPACRSGGVIRVSAGKYYFLQLCGPVTGTGVSKTAYVQLLRCQ